MYCDYLTSILLVMIQEEAVDHQEVLREKCGELPKCSSLKDKLDTCNERVSGKSSTTETCTEELFDFVHCVDHCVSKMFICRYSVYNVILSCYTGGKEFVQETKIANPFQ